MKIRKRDYALLAVVAFACLYVGPCCLEQYQAEQQATKFALRIAEATSPRSKLKERVPHMRPYFRLKFTTKGGLSPEVLVEIKAISQEVRTSSESAEKSYAEVEKELESLPGWYRSDLKEIIREAREQFAILHWYCNKFRLEYLGAKLKTTMDRLSNIQTQIRSLQPGQSVPPDLQRNIQELEAAATLVLKEHQDFAAEVKERQAEYEEEEYQGLQGLIAKGEEKLTTNLQFVLAWSAIKAGKLPDQPIIPPASKK